MSGPVSGELKGKFPSARNGTQSPGICVALAASSVDVMSAAALIGEDPDRTRQ